VTEQELILGCIQNDERCQRTLFEKYAGKMLTVCLRYARDKMEAEDWLQDAFVKVFRNISQFKAEGSFEGWIRRIVVNTSLKHLQKKKIHFEEVDADRGNYQSVDPYVYSHLSEADLMKLINELPDGYKLVFNLHVIEGYSHDEIAAMLGIQDSTSRSQLVKARRYLQQAIISVHKQRLAV
jgi:RNA polymerase sigma factor (sigma-70 family)